MVDKTNLQHLAELSTELQQIGQARDLLDDGGRIMTMGIGRPLDEHGHGWAPPVMVSTEYMQYPPQMVDQIKTLLGQRETAILQEFQQMGVTGFEAQSRGAHPRQPAQPAAAPQRPRR